MRTIYYGGTILTMEENQTVQAVLVEDGIIKKTGSEEVVMALKKEGDILICLEGKTLMPGFIDSHSHISALAQTMGLVQLDGVKDFQEIKQKIQAYIQTTHPKKGQWIMGFGYDHNFCAEKRHPDKYVLDEISRDYCILLSHKSGHMGVVNSMGLKSLGIDENTKDPEGGFIGRDKKTHELTGYLEETAFTVMATKMERPSFEQMTKQYQMAEAVYFSNGITTIQDGLTKKQEWQMLKAVSDMGNMRADVVAYLDIRDYADLLKENKEYEKKYHKHLKIGGYKLFLDGSPQGRTAWMSKPYRGEDKEYCGYPVYTDKQVDDYMRKAAEDKQQILVHCNGDAAAEQMIDSYEGIQKEKPGIDLRPVMIHAQLVRRDQLKRMAQLKIMASFFIAHTYYWGDIHLKNFGEERAKAISPARTAKEDGLCFTFHQDTPVILPNMIETIWCAVNRISKNGIVMGEEEKISVLDALKAVTIHAAYQYFEDDIKGSITEGKVADFVILDKNPMDRNPKELREIQVLETIKHGVSVYKKEAKG